MKCLTTLVFALILVMSGAACNRNEPPSAINEPAKIDSKPAVVSVSIGPGLFRSNKYHLEAQLPPGWAAVEGPELLTPTGHMEGQVAFNSWGQENFWVREVRKENPDGSATTTYGNSRDVMLQIPEGGAYISLLRFGGTGGGPPPPPDYVPPPDSVTDDLSNLWQPHDWRQDSATDAQSKDLFKWGRWLEMWVACRPEAADETVAELNDLLQSWRFDTVPVGDIEWAGLQARKLLPEEVEPLKFGNRPGSYGSEEGYRITQAEVRGDTVRFRFMYRWNVPPQGTIDQECPKDTCHWWDIDVLPTGEAVMVDEGGAKLPVK